MLVTELLEFEFYVVNTEKQSDTTTETFQCSYTKYKHPWKATHPINVVSQNDQFYNITTNWGLNLELVVHKAKNVSLTETFVNLM